MLRLIGSSINPRTTHFGVQGTENFHLSELLVDEQRMRRGGEWATPRLYRIIFLHSLTFFFGDALHGLLVPARSLRTKFLFSARFFTASDFCKA